MAKIVVTGFRPYSITTRFTGNPSEIVAREIAERYGNSCHLQILDANPTCIGEVQSIGKMPGVSGILMLGANTQASSVILELEGVEKEDGITGKLKRKINSSAATRLSAHARLIGVPVASAPATPLVYWCLRSYAAALEWAEPLAIPCVFMHLNTFRISSNSQIETVSVFFEKMRDGI